MGHTFARDAFRLESTHFWGKMYLTKRADKRGRTTGSLAIAFLINEIGASCAAGVTTGLRLTGNYRPRPASVYLAKQFLLREDRVVNAKPWLGQILQVTQFPRIKSLY